MIEIDIQIDSPYQPLINADQLTAIAESALQTCLVSEAALSLVVTSAEVVQQLNRDYRGVDAPTDVLSFEAQLPEDDFFVAEAFAEEEAAYLGDVIIAAPVAAQQAEQAGHSTAEEMMLLAVHGVLHLLGYDHDSPEDKVQMWQKQTEILTSSNLAHIKPTESPH